MSWTRTTNVALTIARWLREQGMGPDRIQVLACDQPAASEGADTNQREIVLSTGEASTTDCVPVELR